MNVTFGQPAQFVATARITTLDGHVGAERQRRLDLEALEIQVIVQGSNCVNAMRAQNVGSVNAHIRHLTLHRINIRNIVNACLLSMRELKDPRGG
jgi:hypothetical protein